MAQRSACAARTIRSAIAALFVATVATGVVAGGDVPPGLKPEPKSGTPSAAGILPAAGNAMTGHGGPVRAVAALEPGGALVTGGFDSAIIVWSLGPSPVARAVLRHHDSTVNALAALPGGCFASGGEDGRIALWCGGSAEPVSVLSGHTAPVAALAASPSANVLASGGWDHTVRLWPLGETQSQSAVTSTIVDGHRGPVNGLTFTPDGTALITAGYDGQLRVTPLIDGAPRADGKAVSVQNEAPVNAVAAFRDGRIVSASADGKLRFYDPALLEIGILDLANGPLTTVAVSPDGSRIVTAGMRTPVTIVDARTIKATAEILGPGLPVWSVAFSGDGRTLITGGADRAVRRWDPKTGQPAGTDIAGAFEDATASDPHPGARVFRACKACHGLTEGDVRAGPTLYGIMGRKVGTEPGYVYSEALKTREIIWSRDTVAKLFEVGPNAYLPGTKMPEQTISNPEDRKALVDWLADKTGR